MTHKSFGKCKTCNSIEEMYKFFLQEKTEAGKKVYWFEEKCPHCGSKDLTGHWWDGTIITPD